MHFGNMSMNLFFIKEIIKQVAKIYIEVLFIEIKKEVTSNLLKCSGKVKSCYIQTRRDYVPIKRDKMLS